MAFMVGQWVVCVNANFVRRGQLFVDAKGESHRSTGQTGGIIEGAVYMIASIHRYACGDSIFLCEIPPRSASDEGYFSTRFRPLTETKSSISFTEGAPKDSEKFDNRKKQRVRA